MPKIGGNSIAECMEICMSDPKLREEVADSEKRREVCYAACSRYLDSGLRISTNFEVDQKDGQYIINGEPNPTITLVRGLSYSFHLGVPGHPFFIKTERSTGAQGRYDKGIINNGTETALLSFDVPLDAPDRLYYNCSLHETMGGTIEILNEEDINLITLVDHYKTVTED